MPRRSRRPHWCLPSPFIGVQAIMCGLIGVADASLVSPSDLPHVYLPHSTSRSSRRERRQRETARDRTIEDGWGGKGGRVLCKRLLKPLPLPLFSRVVAVASSPNVSYPWPLLLQESRSIFCLSDTYASGYEAIGVERRQGIRPAGRQAGRAGRQADADGWCFCSC